MLKNMKHVKNMLTKHGLNKHGLDKHSIDKHGLDIHGHKGNCSQFGIDFQSCYKSFLCVCLCKLSGMLK